MYRHFAALTLAISGAVSIVANGQPQQVQAQSHELAELGQAELNKFGANQPLDKRSAGGAGGRGNGLRDSIDEPRTAAIFRLTMPGRAPWIRRTDPACSRN